jgi:hypothetical protein
MMPEEAAIFVMPPFRAGQEQALVCEWQYRLKCILARDVGLELALPTRRSCLPTGRLLANPQGPG